MANLLEYKKCNAICIEPCFFVNYHTSNYKLCVHTLHLQLFSCGIHSSNPCIILHCNTVCIIHPHCHFQQALIVFRVYQMRVWRSHYLPKGGLPAMFSSESGRTIRLLDMCEIFIQTHTQSNCDKLTF
jgi:hypothetical protein